MSYKVPCVHSMPTVNISTAWDMLPSVAAIAFVGPWVLLSAGSLVFDVTVKASSFLRCEFRFRYDRFGWRERNLKRPPERGGPIISSFCRPEEVKWSKR